MHPQKTPASRRHDVEVTARLGSLNPAERKLTSRNGNVCGIVAGDLDKEAGVWSTLEQLAGRVEVARTKANQGGDLPAISNLLADLLQGGAVFVVHVEKRKQGKIIARLQSLQVRANECLSRFRAF